jgi:hypothetical protein
LPSAVELGIHNFVQHLNYIIMAKYFSIIFGIIITGCLVMLWPRPIEAKVPVITHPEYDEETIQTCAENIWDLYYQLQDCPAMMEEVMQNPLLKDCYLCASHNDCINCAALLMFKLWDSSDVWADTLGESEAAETVVEDVVYLLHEQTLLDEYLLRQKKE